MTETKYRKIIFDASALIALIAKEQGWENIRDHLSKAIMSSINISEVYKYFIEHQNIPSEECKNIIRISGITVYPFTDDHALKTAELVHSTKKYGLSLADRACLALSILTGYPILTCDKVWTKLDLGLDIICPR